MNDEAVRFGPQRSLVGIVTTPHGPDAGLPAVVLLNAGLMHRVGPNRTYVQLARALAAQGFMVLRFDFSGMGDSRPRADHLPYVQSAPQETAEAMDWLAEHRGARRFVLIGHCAGAGFAFLVGGGDPRVAGIVMINFEGGDEQWTEVDRRRKVSRQYASYYGGRALFDRERWARLLGGKTDYRSIARNLLKDVLWYRLTLSAFRVRRALGAAPTEAHAKQAPQARQLLQAIEGRGAPLLVIHSEGSTGLEQVRAAFGGELERLQAAGKLQLTIIPQSDHLFMLVARQRLLCDTIATWAAARFGAAVAEPAAPAAA